MENTDKAAAISLARKCYYQFCEEFLTALKNIEGIKTAIAWQNFDDPKECSMAMREAACYKEIWERAKKEVGLNEPQPDWMKLRDKRYYRDDIDDFLDKLFPQAEYLRHYGEREKMERRKGAMAEFLAGKVFESFQDGYVTRAFETELKYGRQYGEGNTSAD